MVVCVIAFGLLAVWQWDRAHTRVIDPATLPRAAISDVSEPGPQVDPSAVGRPVQASGVYIAKDRFFVADRSANAERGYWVMVPLELSDSTRIPIVRGYVKTLDAPGAQTPPGEVEVDGTLQGSEDLAQIPPIPRDGSNGDVLAGIATSELVGLIQGPLHPGWIAATAESPAPAPSITRLDASDLAVSGSGLKLQNVAYTIQWTVFALFVVFVYRKFLLDARAEYERDRGSASDAPTIEESV